MKIEIRFIEEPGDESSDWRELFGRTLTASAVDSFHLELPVDLYSYTGEGGVNRKEAMDTGSVRLIAHGDRPQWS